MSESAADEREPGIDNPRAFAFVFVTVVLAMLALGIVVPVLPGLVEGFTGTKTTAAETIGWFGTGWALMQFLFSPIVGVASDRWGRRPIMLLSSLGLGLDYVLMAMAPTLAWLFVGRLISGACAATFSTASAYIADTSPPDKRAHHYGMLGAAFGIGFVIGPALGGVLGDIHLRLPFWVAGALCLLNALYGWFVVPESLPADKRTPFSWAKANPVGSLDLLWANTTLRGLAVVGLAVGMAHTAYSSIWVLYCEQRWAWNKTTMGIVLAFTGVASAVVAAGLIGKIVNALGAKTALVFGLVCGLLEFVFYGGAPSAWVFLGGALFGAFLQVASSAEQAIATQIVSASDQGKLQGALSSLNGIASMLGPILFTQVFAHTANTAYPGAAFFVGAVLMGIAAMVAFRLPTRPADTDEKGAPQGTAAPQATAAPQE